MDLGLSGFAVIVTGGSGGIGRGLVQGFAADIADLVLFLASERGAHITGQLVSASGGSWMP